jgi:hypothetical protein
MCIAEAPPPCVQLSEMQAHQGINRGWLPFRFAAIRERQQPQDRIPLIRLPDSGIPSDLFPEREGTI